MLNKKTVCLLLALLLSSCVSSSPTDRARKSYHDLGSVKPQKLSISGIRHQALRDSALSLGARAGLAWRAEHINAQVSKHEPLLDRIYNFNALMLEKYVLPPVLIEARQTFDRNSDDTIRIADRQYMVQQQAKFTTVAPTWRDYLLLRYQHPENPDRSLLPKNQIEKQVWDHFIDEGWQAGITQADSIFQEHLGRIKRDIQGMILYRTLLAQKMVSPPFVAEVNFGVTGGDNELAVNDRILHITAMPSFNQKSEMWETEITRTKRN
jgi:defect-in-organelle-trafficking protein DotC